MSELADSTTRRQSAADHLAAEVGLPNPLRTVRFDVVLRPAGSVQAGQKEIVQP